MGQLLNYQMVSMVKLFSWVLLDFKLVSLVLLHFKLLSWVLLHFKEAHPNPNYSGDMNL
jgi:hypothetical protein